MEVTGALRFFSWDNRRGSYFRIFLFDKSDEGQDASVRFEIRNTKQINIRNCPVASTIFLMEVYEM